MAPRMIDLMRQAAVPANVMRSAARGALSLPPAEVIEILVYLSTNALFAEQARLTLAGWDEASSRAVAADPHTSQAVLDYLASPENLRPCLVPTLIENPSLPEDKLLALAEAAKGEILAMLLASPRVQRSDPILHALESNPQLDDRELQQVRCALQLLGEHAADAGDAQSAYEIEHAAEIAAEEGRSYQIVGDIFDLGVGEGDMPWPGGKPPESSEPELTEVAVALQKPPSTHDAEARERISVLQKIARLSVGERVQLAMKGSRDERFILIRDGAKVVACAVLESPKLTENEVELFASMKNVQEVVLRTIALKRKFMKIYAVVRALANNPRSPIDLGLPLLNRLLLNDLRHLTMNKNVPDTIRKGAVRLYKQRTSEAGRGQ